MATFAVSIRKQSQYFGELRTFGNTYHYSTDVGEPFDDEAVATSVAIAEKEITQSTVEFIGWESWGPTDGAPLANVMRASGEFDGFGEGVASPGTYKEACALVVWPIARSPVFNRKRWLRKFIRVPGYSFEVTAPDVLAGSAPMSAGMQGALVAFGNDVKNIPYGASTANLSTEDGERMPVGTNAEVRPFLFTRQIGN